MAFAAVVVCPRASSRSCHRQQPKAQLYCVLGRNTVLVFCFNRVWFFGRYKGGSKLVKVLFNGIEAGTGFDNSEIASPVEIFQAVSSLEFYAVSILVEQKGSV